MFLFLLELELQLTRLIFLTLLLYSLSQILDEIDLEFEFQMIHSILKREKVLNRQNLQNGRVSTSYRERPI